MSDDDDDHADDHADDGDHVHDDGDGDDHADDDDHDHESVSSIDSCFINSFVLCIQCSPTNTTYALCIVNDGNITVVSEEFSGEELLNQCAETFLDEHLTTHVCHDHDHDEEETEDSHPTSAQSMSRICFKKRMF